MGQTMDGYQRYALYYAPQPGPLADFAAHWLGWDAVAGTPVPHPEVPDLPRPLSALTEAPRKYGFHATIKPPFRLAQGLRGTDLHQAAATLAQTLAPVRLDGLDLTNLDGFLALTPAGDVGPLGALAGRIVTELDPLRAPLTAAEIARRLQSPLTDRHKALLDRWGYPYVLEQFRFHMTLTGNLPAAEAAVTAAILGPLLAPLVPRPCLIDSLCLFGEAADGQFHLVHRYTLSG